MPAAESRTIHIHLGDRVYRAELNDTATADRVRQALPIEGIVSRWGQEIYFEIPVKADRGGTMRTEMQAGEIAFWPPGHAFCIFWGRTPASHADEPRAASDVIPIGRLLDPPAGLDDIIDGTPVTIESA